MSVRKGKSRGLVTRSQIKKWEREYAALGRKAQKIEDERSVIKTMIDAAKSLPDREPAPAAPAAPRKRRTPAPRRTRAPAPTPAPAPSWAAPPKASATPATENAAPKVDRRRQPKSEWAGIIREIALTSLHPVPYAEARDEIMKTSLAEKLQRSEKGFYHAISKLSKAGEIVAYKGHLFSPESFNKFKLDLAAGLVKDLKIPNAAHRSPMGDAISQMMTTRPNGAESGHIIWELRKNPDFAAAIEKNKTHPYNVLARMLRAGELVKKGKRYYAPIEKNETPPTREGVSSVTGEDMPTSLFAQPDESQTG